MAFGQASQSGIQADNWPPPPGQDGHFRFNAASPLDVLASWRSAKFLSQNLVDDFAMNIGQPAIGTLVAERELLVIDAEKVQDGGVKVVGAGGLPRGFP